MENAREAMQQADDWLGVPQVGHALMGPTQPALTEDLVCCPLNVRQWLMAALGAWSPLNNLCIYVCSSVVSPNRPKVSQQKMKVRTTIEIHEKLYRHEHMQDW